MIFKYLNKKILNKIMIKLPFAKNAKTKLFLLSLIVLFALAVYFIIGFKLPETEKTEEVNITCKYRKGIIIYSESCPPCEEMLKKEIPLLQSVGVKFMEFDISNFVDLMTLNALYVYSNETLNITEVPIIIVRKTPSYEVYVGYKNYTELMEIFGCGVWE